MFKEGEGEIAAPKFCNPEMMNISRYTSRCRFSSTQRTYRRSSLTPLLWAKTHRNHKSLLKLLNRTFEGGVLTSTSFFSRQLLCSTVQKALFEEEERVQTLSQQVRSLEKANSHLREKVKTMKRQLRQAQRDTTKEQQTLNLKQLYEPKTAETHPDQDTAHPPLKKALSKRPKK